MNRTVKRLRRTVRAMEQQIQALEGLPKSTAPKVKQEERMMSADKHELGDMKFEPLNPWRDL